MNSQPEKTLSHLSASVVPRGRSFTSNCTNAPSSGKFSQGAVFSQARSLITTLPKRIASPGLSSTSCVCPLRLFNKPSTATRSAIGVPMMSPETGAILSFVGCALPVLVGARVLSSDDPHATSVTSKGNNSRPRVRIMMRPDSTPHNHQWHVAGVRRAQSILQDDMRHRCLSD